MGKPLSPVWMWAYGGWERLPNDLAAQKSLSGLARLDQESTSRPGLQPFPELHTGAA